MSHVTYMDESCHIHKWVMWHIWMRHVTHMNESCHTYERIVWHIWMRSQCAWIDMFADQLLSHISMRYIALCTSRMYSSLLWICLSLLWLLLSLLRMYTSLLWIYADQLLSHISMRHTALCTSRMYTSLLWIYMSLLWMYTSLLWFVLSLLWFFWSLLRDRCLFYGYMRHIALCTSMNESCHTYEWVMSHVWMSHVTHTHESWHAYEWVMSPVRVVQHHCRSTAVAHVHASCRTPYTYERVCHTYELVMSHI